MDEEKNILDSILTQMKSLLAIDDDSKTCDFSNAHISSAAETCNNTSIKKCSCHVKVFHPITKLWHEKLKKSERSNDENDSCPSDIPWKLVLECLRLLSEVKETLESIDSEHIDIKTNMLGVNDGTIVRNIVEVIIALGIFPNLCEGIGLPLKTKFNDFIPRRDQVEERKLLVCINTLFDIMENESIKNIIFTMLFNDIIASLIQLAYRPRQRLSITCCCFPDGSCLSCGTLTKEEISSCRMNLNKFLNETYQPLVVKHLLILQRTGPAGVRPKYKWFMNVLGKLLSQRLLHQGGVKAVIAGILDGCNTDAMNWEKYKAIGKIISQVPRQISSKREYYMKIGEQIMKFLVADNLKDAYPYIAVSLACLNHMLMNDEDLCIKYIIESTLSPALQSVKASDKSSRFDLGKEKFSKIINFADKIYSNPEFEISRQLENCFMKTSSILFFIHASKHFNITTHRSQLNNVLASMLSNLESTKSTNLIFRWMFTGNEEITIHLSDDTVVNSNELSTDYKIDCMLSILEDSRLEHLRGEVFSRLLTKFGNSISNPQPKYGSKPLLELDLSISDIAEKIQLSAFISAIMDEFGDSVLQNTEQFVAFIKHILETSLKKENSDEIGINDILPNDEENVNLALMLLSTLFGANKLTNADFKILSTLKSSLEEVSRKSQEKSTRQLASDLGVYIATRGIVKPTSPQTSQVDALGNVDDLQSEHAYLAAIKDLTDPLLPTRGHALIMLSKLLENRNKFALENHENLLEIFQANLASDDSYLYLASIDGLTSLADIHHRTVLPLLCEKFSGLTDSSKVKLSSESRMKICEAMVKSCRLCGEILPVYALILFPTLFMGVKDDDALIRACSLSALGDVCMLLKYSIRKHIAEIFNCISHVLKTDQSTEVRRSAVQFFAFLLKGVDTKLFEIVPDELRDIYRLLKTVLEVDRDNVTRLHADNAISILNDVIMDGIYNTNNRIERKIQI